MGVTKTSLFTEEQNLVAQIAKVLGHPARIAILQYLLKADKCINGELVNELGLAQATISQHLKELKTIGLLQGTIEGVAVCYCIDPVKWGEMKSLLNSFFEKYKAPEKIECC